MARSVNKVQLIGNVGQEPEFKTSGATGTRFATFSLATSESRRDKDTSAFIERTDWHRIAVFNENLVRMIEQYVRKGSKLSIEGRLETRTWDDNQGQRRYMTEVILSRFGGELVLLGTPRSEPDFGAKDDVGARSEWNPDPPTAPARPRSRGDYVAAARSGGPFDDGFDPGDNVAARSGSRPPSGAAFRPSRPPGGAGGAPRKEASSPSSSGQVADPDYSEDLDDSIPF